MIGETTSAGPAPERYRSITRNDRFSSVFVVLVVAGALILGLVLRGRASGQTWDFNSREAGIEVTYPAGWLTDESNSYVVRIRDPRARPFKTLYMITTVPAGGQTSIRNVLDGLTVQRSSDLPAYRVLNVQDTLVGTVRATEMSFAYVDADPNPFSQRLPVVVQGLDVLIRDQDRVIVLTFMASADDYDSELPGFQRFLQSLQY